MAKVLTQSNVAEKRALVKRVVASPEICRSTRLRDLFLYLCGRVLDADAQDIHELEVGHSVFGRAAQYDTTADNIVRVHASMLRKRLAEYFENEGRDESLVIEIPRGNYAPVFRERPASPARLVELDRLSVEPPPLLNYTSADEILLTRPPLAPITAPSANPNPWWRPRNLLVGSVIACVLCLLAFFFLRGRIVSSGAQPALAGAEVKDFWAQVFSQSAAANVVLDDASLDFYQEATGRSVSLTEYFDRSYLTSLEKSSAGSQFDPPLLHALLLRRQSSFAASSLIGKFDQVAGELHSSYALHFARDLSYRQIKAENVILLGNRQSDPWIQAFESRLSLLWAFDPALRTYYPRDNNSPAAKQDQYRTTSPGGQSGYATISFLPNLSDSGSVLILSATGGSAMASALDFLLNESAMEDVRSRLPAAPSHHAFPYFEMLLQMQKGARGRSSAQVISCRLLPSGR